MFTGIFWKDAFERFVKTFAQGLLAVLLVAPHSSIIGFDWPSALGVAATAAAISLLMSIVSAVGTNGISTVSPASAAPDERGLS